MMFIFVRSILFLKTFIEVLHKVCEDESRDMMDMLDQSRNEIQDMAVFIQEEQKALRETLQKLKSQRTNNERDSESRMSTMSCIDGVANGGRKKRKNRKNPGSRPVSARSLPAASSTQITIEEEKETIFHNLDSAEVKLDQERRRQAARLEELKERKRQKQTDNASKARELLEEADNLTKMLDKCKVQQQEKVKEIVQERKKKREESVPEVQTIHVKPAYDSSGSSNGGAGAGAGAAASPDEPSTDNWNTEMHI